GSRSRSRRELAYRAIERARIAICIRTWVAGARYRRPGLGGKSVSWANLDRYVPSTGPSILKRTALPRPDTASLADNDLRHHIGVNRADVAVGPRLCKSEGEFVVGIQAGRLEALQAIGGGDGMHLRVMIDPGHRRADRHREIRGCEFVVVDNHLPRLRGVYALDDR